MTRSSVPFRHFGSAFSGCLAILAILVCTLGAARAQVSPFVATAGPPCRSRIWRQVRRPQPACSEATQSRSALSKHGRALRRAILDAYDRARVSTAGA